MPRLGTLSAATRLCGGSSWCRSVLAASILGCLLDSASGAAKSYYDLLQVSKDADAQQIRRQFRKLSVKLHPDKNPSADTPQGRKDFEELQRANEWLSSDDRRQLYDLYGDWGSSNDRMRGQQFAGKHSAIEFFRDEPLIKNVVNEVEAQEIFGLKSKRAYLMILYAPWLSSGQEATDVYRKVARSLRDSEKNDQDGIRLAAVNCESSLQSFCLRYGRLRNQFELPVVLLLDPTEGLIDRYKGRMDAEQLYEYTIASDLGIRHVNTLDQASFSSRIGDASGSSQTKMWLVLFCTQSEPLCQELKPIFKRLAYSARGSVSVGLVNCKERRGADGYGEVEPFCVEQGATEVPTLVAYRKGWGGDLRSEVIPLLLEEHDDSMMATPMLVLRAMEAVLRLGTADANPAGESESAEDESAEDSASEGEEPPAAPTEKSFDDLIDEL